MVEAIVQQNDASAMSTAERGESHARKQILVIGKETHEQPVTGPYTLSLERIRGVGWNIEPRMGTTPHLDGTCVFIN